MGVGVGWAAATCASVGRSPRDPRPRWWSRYGSRSSTLLQLPEPEQVGTFCCVESRESGADDGLPPDLGICKSNLPLGSAAFTSSPHRRQAVEGRARCLAGAAKAAFSLQKILATPKKLPVADLPANLFRPNYFGWRLVLVTAE